MTDRFTSRTHRGRGARLAAAATVAVAVALYLGTGPAHAGPPSQQPGSPATLSVSDDVVDYGGQVGKVDQHTPAVAGSQPTPATAPAPPKKCDQVQNDLCTPQPDGGDSGNADHSGDGGGSDPLAATQTGGSGAKGSLVHEVRYGGPDNGGSADATPTTVASSRSSDDGPAGLRLPGLTVFEHAGRSPWALPVLAAGLGLLLAVVLMVAPSRRREATPASVTGEAS